MVVSLSSDLYVIIQKRSPKEKTTKHRPGFAVLPFVVHLLALKLIILDKVDIKFFAYVNWFITL